MFYFDKDNPDVLFQDNRELETTLCDGRSLLIKPDVNMDFRNMDYADNTFKVVVFDPPHLIHAGTVSWLANKYGILPSEWKPLLKQLIDSKSWIYINQGLDIRLMTEEKALMIKQMKTKELHFAWDRYQDKDVIIPKFEMFKEITKIDARKLIVFVLVNFDTTIEQDLERIYTLRKLGYWAYVMLYDKEHIPKGHIYKKLARWCNNRFIFAKCERFEDYLANYTV